MARYICPKNFGRVRPTSASKNNGTKPKKMNGVNGEVGQLSHRIIPAARLKKIGCSFFNRIYLLRGNLVIIEQDNMDGMDFH